MSLSFSSLRKKKNQECFYVFPNHFEQLQNRDIAKCLILRNPNQPPPKKPDQTKQNPTWVKYKKTRARFSSNVTNFQSICFKQNNLKQGQNYTNTIPIQMNLPKCYFIFILSEIADSSDLSVDHCKLIQALPEAPGFIAFESELARFQGDQRLEVFFFQLQKGNHETGGDSAHQSYLLCSVST